jgi:hypothetical protein
MEKVLIPALVAAAVTLMIEYLAKPWLEVRKERILVRHRAVGELIRARDILDARLWPLFRVGQPWDAHHTPEAVDDALAATRHALDALAAARNRIPMEVSASMRPVLLDLHNVLRGLRSHFANNTWEEKRDQREVIQQCADWTLELSAYLDTPRWRWRKRRALKNEAGGYMAP